MLNLDSNIQFIKAANAKDAKTVKQLGSFALTALFIFIRENMKIGRQAKNLKQLKAEKQSV